MFKSGLIVISFLENLSEISLCINLESAFFAKDVFSNKLMYEAIADHIAYSDATVLIAVFPISNFYL